jgi:membrane protein implicated in regulation of membrane protease activity
MDTDKHIIPATAVRGIATGLFLMAFFTLLWAGIAFRGLFGGNYWLALLAFPVFSIIFVVNGIRLYRVAKENGEMVRDYFWR